MRCDHPDCTGSHDDRKYATLCPRTKENKRKQGARSYRNTRENHLNRMARYRTTSNYMLSQVRYEATRRGGRTRATTE